VCVCVCVCVCEGLTIFNDCLQKCNTWTTRYIVSDKFPFHFSDIFPLRNSIKCLGWRW